MVIFIIWKKPYLNDSALVVGEDHAERGKYCGVGTNNMLEIWMALGEIMLWSAAMGNAAMGGANARSDEAALEAMSNHHPVGNVVCAILEWIGIIMFLMGAMFCFYEVLMVFVEERCRKTKKKTKESTKVAVVPKNDDVEEKDSIDDVDKTMKSVAIVPKNEKECIVDAGPSQKKSHRHVTRKERNRRQGRASIKM